MMEIRRAVEADAFCLARILSDWIDETPWMPRLHSREEDFTFVRDMVHGGGVDVLCIDGNPVGFLQETDGHISALYVARDARRMGVGKRLVRQAKERSDALDLWTFEANVAALSFYGGEDFTEVERSTDNDEGLPDIRLKWTRGRE